MLFAQLWQTMESNLQRAAAALVAARSPQRCSRDIERLSAAIADAKAELTGLNTLLEELRGQIAVGRKRADRLTAQVAECVKAGYESQAWPLALELDEVYRLLAEEQAELRRGEQVCWSQEFRLRQLQRKLDQLRGQLRRLGPPRLR